jgi:hypothetical protein
MSRYRIQRMMDTECKIGILSASQVKGNQPTSKYNVLPRLFPCNLNKDKASIASTIVGDVPVTTYKLLLTSEAVPFLPEGELKENDRVYIGNRTYSVLEAKAVKRRRYVQYIYAEVRRIT